jgi:hypothetical protein
LGRVAHFPSDTKAPANQLAGALSCRSNSDTLVSLCRFHHRRRHDGRFLIRREPSGDFHVHSGQREAARRVEPQPAFGDFDLSGWTDSELARTLDGVAPFSQDYAVSVLADSSVFRRAAGAAARAGPAP